MPATAMDPGNEIQSFFSREIGIQVRIAHTQYVGHWHYANTVARRNLKKPLKLIEKLLPIRLIDVAWRPDTHAIQTDSISCPGKFLLD
jgi:hypothetical protein